jgi:hypothetical protein
VLTKSVYIYLLMTLAGSAATLAPGTRLIASGTVKIQTDLGGKRVPNWSGHALVVRDGPIGGPDALLAYSKTGQVILNTIFSIPGADRTTLRSWSRGADGALALCGSSFTNDGRGAGFIASISRYGDSQQAVRTVPYVPYLITAASDGTLWTVGRQIDPRHGERSGVNLDAGVLRHFDRSGRLLAAYIPRSTFRNPVELTTSHGFLIAFADGVGWLHYMDTTGNGHFTEVSSGGDITNYPIPRLPKLTTVLGVDGMAITDSGDVFVSMRDVGAGAGSWVFRLDRPTREWVPITLPPGAAQGVTTLYGAEGSDLVFHFPGDPASTLRFAHPAL